MNMKDWYEAKNDKIQMFSVNGVPYPLDEYLALKGEPTTSQVAEIYKRWGITK